MVNWEVSCVEKKAISIIALDPRAARSYGRDVEGLFGEVADVSVFSVMDGSAMGMLPHADLFAASTDAFGSPEELARHVPIDSQTIEVAAVLDSGQAGDLIGGDVLDQLGLTAVVSGVGSAGIFQQQQGDGVRDDLAGIPAAN